MSEQCSEHAYRVGYEGSLIDIRDLLLGTNRIATLVERKSLIWGAVDAGRIRIVDILSHAFWIDWNRALRRAVRAAQFPLVQWMVQMKNAEPTNEVMVLAEEAHYIHILLYLRQHVPATEPDALPPSPRSSPLLPIERPLPRPLPIQSWGTQAPTPLARPSTVAPPPDHQATPSPSSQRPVTSLPDHQAAPSPSSQRTVTPLPAQRSPPSSTSSRRTLLSTEDDDIVDLGSSAAALLMLKQWPDGAARIDANIIH